MVTLAQTITEHLRNKRGELTEDETGESTTFVQKKSVNFEVRFKSYLLSLGVSDPVTKAEFGSGAIYFEKLAEELTSVLLEPLKVYINSPKFALYY